MNEHQLKAYVTIVIGMIVVILGLCFWSDLFMIFLILLVIGAAICVLINNVFQILSEMYKK